MVDKKIDDGIINLARHSQANQRSHDRLDDIGLIPNVPQADSRLGDQLDRLVKLETWPPTSAVASVDGAFTPGGVWVGRASTLCTVFQHLQLGDSPLNALERAARSEPPTPTCTEFDREEDHGIVKLACQARVARDDVAKFRK